MQNAFSFTEKNVKPILVLLYCIAFILLLSNSFNLIIDDAYITFQYAKNFAEHLKPWYNLDPEFQGNGQTSLLWMWIITLLKLLGLKAEFSFYYINIALGFHLIFLTIYHFYFDKKNLPALAFRILLTAFFTYWLAANSSHGLESVLAAYILYFFARNWDSSGNISVILLPLIRPEFALLGILWILDTPFLSKEFFKKIKYFSTGFLIYFGYYFLFFDYYLPLSFVLKSGYFFNVLTLKVFIGYLILFAPVFYYFFTQKKLILGLGFSLMLAYYTFLVGSYSSALYVRYIFPLVIFLFLVPSYKTKIFYFLMLISVLRMFDLGTNFHNDKKIIAKDNEGFFKGYGEIAKTLKPSDKILILDAGHTAYFSNATCYDGYGLNDATLVKAWRNKDSKAYREYVDKKGINYVAISSKTKEFYTPEDKLRTFTYQSLNLKNKKVIKVYPFYNKEYLFLFQY